MRAEAHVGESVRKRMAKRRTSDYAIWEEQPFLARQIKRTSAEEKKQYPCQH